LSVIDYLTLSSLSLFIPEVKLECVWDVTHSILRV